MKGIVLFCNRLLFFREETVRKDKTEVLILAVFPPDSGIKKGYYHVGEKDANNLLFYISIY